ncbi:MAG: DUF1566 domain-containing protein [Nitrospira sp.]|nr:MAG: DUF1566 domain-containing protein [Nitrospira sp.]
MKDGWKNRWVWSVSAVVLIGGLLGTSVVGAKDDKGNPFTQILDKLDQILTKLNSSGGENGNHTLRWDQNLPSASRFTVLTAFQNQAVLDNNTGLVWEQAPALTTANFQDSTYGCANKSIGGLKGWRLPAIPELASLVDPSVAAPGPTLPAGYPFTNVQSVYYWSATTHAVTSSTAWTLSFNTGALGSNNKSSGSHLAWCVRGPMNADTY